MKRRRKRSRGVVDTSVLVAGIAGFRALKTPGLTPSAQFFKNWVQRNTFTWLVSEEILDEYKRVLGRLGVRRNLIGSIVNLIREEAEFVDVPRRSGLSPDPGDDPICDCAEAGRADFIVTLNPKDFPQDRLSARVTAPDDAL
ncbi:MAG: PIN domain-containing protein [Acidobacteria bacterium]|nr:PIN domain-containing protein [Acidobacteriota bacterium]